MQRTPALIGAAALVVIVALFFILRGGDDAESTTSVASTTTAEATTAETTKPEEPRPEDKPEEPKPEPEVATIVIKDGQPVGGVQKLSFEEGGEIRFVVRSDVADHVHLHGYDVFQDVEAGGQVEFKVPATLTGVFEAELEDRVVPIAEITVNPA